MALRSVHLTNAWHPTSGGIRTYYQALLDAAERRREHLAVIVPGEHTAVHQYGEFARLYTLASPFSPVFDRRYRMILPHRFLRVRRSTIWRILAIERPDVVAVSDKYSLVYLGGLIKRRARGGPRPTLVGVSHERMDDNVAAWLGGGAAGQRLVREYLRRVYLPQFDAHVANSAYTARELVEAMSPSSARTPRLTRLRDRVHVCPPGVDTSAFASSLWDAGWRARLLVRAGGAAADTLIVHAGRLSPEKNTMALVGMMADLARSGVSARLVVAGDGPSRAGFEAEAARAAPGRIAVLGHVEARGDLARTLAAADVFVHANGREPFGIGPLEAMASGVPVVVPSSGGVLTYASAANAWLAEPTPQGLASAVASVVRQPALARRRARAGLETAATFTWPSATDRLMDLTARIHAACGSHDRRVDLLVPVRHAK